MERAIIAVLLVALTITGLAYNSALKRLTTASETIAQHEAARATAAATIVELEREQRARIDTANSNMLEWQKRYERAKQELETNANDLNLTSAALERLRSQTSAANARCDEVRGGESAGLDDDRDAARARIDEGIERVVREKEQMYMDCAFALRAFQVKEREKEAK